MQLSILRQPILELLDSFLILSMQSGVLPEETLREFAALQMHAPGMHATLARAQFKGSIGKAPEKLMELVRRMDDLLEERDKFRARSR